MKLTTSISILGCFVLTSFIASTKAEVAKPAHDFVGVGKCGVCHKKPEKGEQLRIWQESKHAEAFKVLASDKAKEIAKAKGIADAQTSEACLQCHSTAYWFGKTKVTEVVPVEESVSCESCHGAGADYKSMGVMKDRQKAIANGLLIPDENTCKQCHNSDSPTFKEFNYKTMWEKIKHPIPGKSSSTPLLDSTK